MKPNPTAAQECDSPQPADTFEAARADVVNRYRDDLISRYGTADPDKLREHGRADQAELQAAETLAHWAEQTLTVGTLVHMPNRLKPYHLGYEVCAEICREPGPIVSIRGRWAMVDLGRWGRFGCSVADLRPAAALRPPAAHPICHGHEHAELHPLTAEDTALLLEWLSGENWTGGPRCLLDILRYVREQNMAVPPLARR